MTLISIVWGLSAAVGFGVSDYVAARSSAKIGYFRTALLMQGIGGVFILVVAFQSLPVLLDSPRTAIITAGLGLLNAVGVLALYKGFEIGKLSIVSPISSSFPALSTVLAITFLNETVLPLRALGILATIGGIVLVTIQGGGEKKPESASGDGTSSRKGVAYGLLAFAAYGSLFFAFKPVVVDLGPFAPVVVLRFATASMLGVVFLVSRPKSKASARLKDVIGLVVVVAILDTLAGVAYNFGILNGEVSVVSTISGLYSVFTIMLAALFLRERLNARQGVGVLVILVGVALLGFGV